MSDNRMNAIGRRQRYRRRLRGEKNAVSPVVATLILILIAVAAAAALYLWLVAWQGGVTKGIGSPSAQYTVTIGGSTSVYPFAAQAATWFEANNSDVVISVNQGGSGAGMAAVCSGEVDIGEASTYYGTGLASTPSTLQTSYGCPSTVSVQVVAYDGVDAIVSNTNTHALQNASWDTLQAVYFDAGSLIGGATAYSGTNLYANQNYHEDGYVAPVQPAQGKGYTWNQIPACAGADLNVCGGGPAEAPITAAATGTVFTPTPATDTCNNALLTVGEKFSFTALVQGTTATNLEQEVVSATAEAPAMGGCTGGGTAPTFTLGSVSLTNSNFFSGVNGNVYANVSFSLTVLTVGTDTGGTFAPTATPLNYEGIGTGVGASSAATSGGDIGVTSGLSPCGFTVCAGGKNTTIQTWFRSDVSGTTQSFISRVLAVGGSGGTPLGLGFTGCSGDNQFDGCNIALPSSYGVSGNPAVIAGVAGSADAIGYASDGLAQASGTVTPVNLQGYGQTVVVKIVGESTALKAIALGISYHETANAAYATSQAYVGWRPFLNVETAPPTGEVLRYLQFVFDPANNLAIAAATAEISVYASGLAGVVPVVGV